jgi:hypothetical protein
MGGMQTILAVIVINAFVLGIAFFAVYEFNKSVRKSGR